MFEMTEIEIFGFLLREPVTTLTDLITATACFISYYLLTKETTPSPIQSLFRYYFLLMGMATFLAAFFSHGILHLVTTNWKVFGWSCSAFSILMIELASIEYGKSFLGNTRYKYLRTFAFIQIAAFFLVMIFPETRTFNMVKLNSTIGLVFVTLPIQALIWRKTQSEGSKIICLAIIWAIVPAITYNTEFTLHKYFNYHDISHVLMTIFIVIMYFGIRKVIDHLETYNVDLHETITTS